MSGEVLEVILFTLKVSALSTLLILPLGIATAWLLARSDFYGKSILETLVTLPLFVPPVATGLILLMVFGRRGIVGAALERCGIEVAFTWRAVVIACAVMSFPLLVRAAQVAFAEVNPRLEQIARSLGASDWRVFVTISLPLAARGIIAGAVLAFARSIGEFGATVVVAGMIPHQTMTLSLSIYQQIELGQDRAALNLLFITIVIVFVTVFCGQIISKPRRY